MTTPQFPSINVPALLLAVAVSACAGEPESPGSSGEPGTTGAGGAGPFFVQGLASRDPDTVLAEDNDGIGTLYVTAFVDECGGQAVATTNVVDADLSDPDGAVSFEFEEVPAGTYFVNAFLDDNGDFDPDDPGPNKGDIVMAEGVGPGCLEVTVDADVVDADLVLNLVLPFDI